MVGPVSWADRGADAPCPGAGGDTAKADEHGHKVGTVQLEARSQSFEPLQFCGSIIFSLWKQLGRHHITYDMFEASPC